ncbi:E3 ubiquitin-protein ligase [Nymphaea thermarum]|nr:E3 ubiquitin-protein ligase [Nymphaea thermarum]
MEEAFDKAITVDKTTEPSNGRVDIASETKTYGANLSAFGQSNFHIVTAAFAAADVGFNLPLLHQRVESVNLYPEESKVVVTGDINRGILLRAVQKVKKEARLLTVMDSSAKNMVGTDDEDSCESERDNSETKKSEKAVIPMKKAFDKGIAVDKTTEASSCRVDIASETKTFGAKLSAFGFAASIYYSWAKRKRDSGSGFRFWAGPGFRVSIWPEPNSLSDRTEWASGGEIVTERRPEVTARDMNGESESSFLVESWDACVDSIDLRKFNAESAVAQYTSLFQHGENRVASPNQGATPLAAAGLISASVDNSLSGIYRSPPRPLPYDADSRYARLQRDGLVSRREKASSHFHEESSEAYILFSWRDLLCKL